MNRSRLDFKAVVKEYSGMAYSLAFRILGNQEDAKDTVQQAFIKLYKNEDNYLAEKSLKNWIYTITLNTARDLYRKKKRHLEMGIFENTTFSAADAGEYQIENSLFTQKLVDVLPLELKEVVALFYLEERSVKEIAEILTISESLVKVRLHRARKKLIEAYGELDS